MSQALRDYWARRHDRLVYVIDQVATGKKEISDKEYEKLVNALLWCNENIESLDDEDYQEAYDRQYVERADD